MKTLLVTLLLTITTGCSTVSGAVKGLGNDVKSGTDTVSNWIKPEQGVKK